MATVLNPSDPGWLSKAMAEVSAGRAVEIRVDGTILRAVVEATQKAAASGPVRLAVEMAARLIPAIPTLPVDPPTLAGVGGLAGAVGAIGAVIGKASAVGMRVEFAWQPNGLFALGDDLVVVRLLPKA